ncbi:unnamed protein product [Schistosoma curassoni]|uniref:PPM-type phosphatase domain-containing protein n=1 Tax=Schistosoma curassoni TaxID=6186 RepID=A0A183L026_9TREM|nr:unnamed protein product [Schistosoma curassoni]
MRCVDDLSMICNETIDMCLYKGSSDNMSMVLVAFDPAPRVDPTSKTEDENLESVLVQRTKGKTLVLLLYNILLFYR